MKKIFAFIVPVLLGLQVNAQVITNGLADYYPFNGNANDMGTAGVNGNPGTSRLLLIVLARSTKRTSFMLL